MKNYSIWREYSERNNFNCLKEDKKVDVLIIGGGITGISTLYHLRNSELNVMLVEQNKIGGSITGNSTGKLTFLQNDLLDKIRTKCGDKVLIEYINSQIYAMNTIVNTIKVENIDCDLERVSSYIYTNKANEIGKLKKLEYFLNNNNIKTYKDSYKFVQSKYMFKVDNTYLINPIKFLNGLIYSDSNIFENTCIKKIIKYKDYYRCYSNHNIIDAKYVIIASHYPYFIIPFMFPLNAGLEKSYMSASRKKVNPVSLISYSNPFISIRNYKEHFIYLSYTNKLCKSINDRLTFNKLKNDLEKMNMRPDFLWSNIDIITNDGLPYIGRLKDNIFIGTGYNTWGLTNGFLAGEIISDIILEKNNKYIYLFDIKRSTIKQYKEITSNIKDNIEGYIKGLTKGFNNHVCPHIGCKLLYNKTEDTWDCPCHGSRFNKDGICISGPSNKDIYLD